MLIGRKTVVFFALCGLAPALLVSEDKRADQLVHALGEFSASMKPSTGTPIPFEVRRRSLYEELRKLDDQAFPTLCNGLTDPDINVRQGVALFLAVMGSTWYNHQGRTPVDIHPCLQGMIIALEDPDLVVRARLAEALGNIGSDAAAAVPVLIKWLEGPNEKSRYYACIGLYGVGPAAEAALPSLRKALSHPSSLVQRYALRAIERIESSK